MHVTTGEVDAAYNGLVLYDPATLEAFYGGSIPDESNLVDRYTTSGEGDEVLAAGCLVPVLAITDDGYTVHVYLSETWQPAPGVRHVCENSTFALRVSERAVVVPVAQLFEWYAEYARDGLAVDILPGAYSVKVIGWNKLGPHREIEEAGYTFELWPASELPEVTADVGRDMTVLGSRPDAH